MVAAEIENHKHTGEILPDQFFPDSWIDMPVLRTFDLIDEAKAHAQLNPEHSNKTDFHMLHFDDMHREGRVRFLVNTYALNEEDEIADEGENIHTVHTQLDYSKKGLYHVMKRQKYVHEDEQRMRELGLIKGPRHATVAFKLQNSEEYLWYIASEESFHSKDMWSYGNVSDYVRARDEYMEFLRARGAEYTHPYDWDIFEINANRQAVLSLAMRNEKLGNKNRADRLYSVYEESIQKGAAPVPDFRRIFFKMVDLDRRQRMQ